MLTHTLPDLSFPYDALEPHIDALTMEIHHGRHHQAYITNYTKLLEGTDIIQKYSPEELLSHLDEVDSEKKQGVINNLGGHLNHSFFWSILTPNPLNRVLSTGQLSTAIQDTFGSFDEFRDQFAAKALTVFGSGWAWLVKDKDGKLALRQTIGQNTPLSDGEKPIIGIDVWEHAYYLKHQNKRADYIAAFWNVVDWKKAEEYFSE
ncbi:superoxide dismutase [Candidatus Gracilibacteria bacterium]|nr:superoxide dismutase [Candidatus Gracilibacteria bacterium]